MREGRGRDERLLRGKGSRERRCDSQTQARDRLGRGKRNVSKSSGSKVDEVGIGQRLT